MNSIRFITALPAELKSIPKEYRRLAVCGGVGSNNAQIAAKNAITEGAQILISFGVAGALNPRLKVGDLVISSKVIKLPDDFAATELENLEGLESEVTNHTMKMLTVDRPVFSSEQKAKLFQRFQCDAVDMESYAIAKVASDHNIPFLCVRSISDDTSANLPKTIDNIFTDDGKVSTFAIVKEIFKSPRFILDLIRMQQNFSVALNSLKSCEQTLIDNGIDLFNQGEASWQNS